MKTIKLLMIGLLTVSLSFSCKKKAQTPQEQNTTPVAPVEQFTAKTFTIPCIELYYTGDPTVFSGPIICRLVTDGAIKDSVMLTKTTVTVQAGTNCDYFSAPYTQTVKEFKLKKGVNSYLKIYDGNGFLTSIEITDQGNYYTENSPRVGVITAWCSSTQQVGIKY